MRRDGDEPHHQEGASQPTSGRFHSPRSGGAFYGALVETAEVFPDLVIYDEKGLPFTVKYHELAPMLLNEMKKQQRVIEAQKQEYQNEIAALETRLARVESREAR